MFSFGGSKRTTTTTGGQSPWWSKPDKGEDHQRESTVDELAEAQVFFSSTSSREVTARSGSPVFPVGSEASDEVEAPEERSEETWASALHEIRESETSAGDPLTGKPPRASTASSRKSWTTRDSYACSDGTDLGGESPRYASSDLASPTLTARSFASVDTIGSGTQEELDAAMFDQAQRVTPSSQADSTVQDDDDDEILLSVGVEFCDDDDDDDRAAAAVQRTIEPRVRTPAPFSRKNPMAIFQRRGSSMKTEGRNFFRDRFGPRKSLRSRRKSPPQQHEQLVLDRENAATLQSGALDAPSVLSSPRRARFADTVVTGGPDSPTQKRGGTPTKTEQQQQQQRERLRVDDAGAVLSAEKKPLEEESASPPPEEERSSHGPQTEEEKAYGVAVGLLVKGISKQELEAELLKLGRFSAETVKRVTEDFARILPKSPQQCCDHLPDNLQPFAKMLKMGVPPSAVEHKMKAAGLSDQDFTRVGAFVSGGGGGSGFGPSAAHAPKPLPPKKKTLEEEYPALVPYLKMLKVGVAVENVLAKMRAEDVAEAEILAFAKAQGIKDPKTQQGEREDTNTSTAAENEDGRPKSRVMGLHWEKIHSQQQAQKSVWAAEQTELDHEDVAALEDMFAARPSEIGGQGQTNGDREPPPKKAKAVTLLDKKRTQNVTIALSKFARQFRRDFNALWRAVYELADELDSEALDRLKETVPTPDECDVVAHWVRARVDEEQTPDEKDDDQRLEKLAESRLGLAERFVLATHRADSPAKHLETARRVRTFGARADEVTANAETVSTAAGSLVASKGLALTLQRILAVGNVMNAGTRRGDARGIRLGSLLAIVKTKGRDKKTTVLDYVVAGLVKRGHAPSLDEVASPRVADAVAAAAKVSVADTQNTLAALQKNLAAVIETREADARARKPLLQSIAAVETALMADADPRNTDAPPPPPKIKSATSPSRVSAALSKSLGFSSSGRSTPHRRSGTHLGVGGDSSCVDYPENNAESLTPEKCAEAAAVGRRWARLDDFIADATRTVAWLEEERAKPMIANAEGLCEYFGEDPANYKNAAAIFDTIGTFLQAFKTSYDAAARRAAKDKRLEDRRRRNAAVLERRLVDRSPVVSPKGYGSGRHNLPGGGGQQSALDDEVLSRRRSPRADRFGRPAGADGPDHEDGPKESSVAILAASPSRRRKKHVSAEVWNSPRKGKGPPPVQVAAVPDAWAAFASAAAITPTTDPAPGCAGGKPPSGSRKHRRPPA